MPEYVFLKCWSDYRPEFHEKVESLAKNPQAKAQQVKTAGVHRYWVSNRPEAYS